MEVKRKLLDTEIEQFLTYLAVERKVSPNTQKQAFSAILFLYKEALGIDMSSWNIQALRAQERKHIPQALTKNEVKKVINNLTGTYQLIVYLGLSLTPENGDRQKSYL